MKRTAWLLGVLGVLLWLRNGWLDDGCRTVCQTRVYPEVHGH